MNNSQKDFSLKKIEKVSKKNPFQSLSEITNNDVFPKKERMSVIDIQHPKSPVTICSVDELNVVMSDKNVCCHNIVDDYIDITPDRSMRIKYCDICMVTFH